ncbi:uncharacterized protein LOC112557890 isoform X3 [Pomacea canaliculata]|uniref:uncharacterized protein LOC112557890 isoform X3 n=1 Tax=Pomacea canaliculata TaxID=400727 RepID=UPI000D7283A9|nr:uncharacterized protein LOC112557890 isoform X3 [Pomacea canaliculata]
MEPKPFGVSLKPTGADAVRDKSFTSTSSSSIRTSASIHTPLKPVKVQDLKAMFDSEKKGAGAAAQTSQGSRSGQSSPRSGASSPRSGATSPRSGASSPGHAVHLGKKSETVLNTTSNVRTVKILGPSNASELTTVKTNYGKSSLGADTSKSMNTRAVESVSTPYTSSFGSSSKDNSFPSRINFSTSTSSSLVSKSDLKSNMSKLSDGTENRASTSARQWMSKSVDVTASDTKLGSSGLRLSGLKTAENNSQNRVEIPVHHMTGSSNKSSSLPSTFTSGRRIGGTTSATSPARLSSGESVTSAVKSFQQAPNSLAADKKNTSAVSITTNKQVLKKSCGQTPADNKKSSSHLEAKEILIKKLPSALIKPEQTSLQVTKMSGRQSSTTGNVGTGNKKTDKTEKSKDQDTSVSRIVSVRKLSNERFERLKFDFERGVPTEGQELKGLSTTDHIELQLKARELNAVKDNVTETEKLKKEESIFAQGMKVSDFVKHINTVHPPSQTTGEKKWTPVKIHRAVSEPTNVGENEYIEMPEEGDQEGIYEYVEDPSGGSKVDRDGEETEKGGWLYRKEKGRQASLKVKKSSSLPREGPVSKTDEADHDDQVNLSDGDSCASDHSSSTEYEPVEGENLYEDPEVLELSGSDKRKDDDKKSLGVKLKKNVDKATHYLNKIGTKFNKKRGKEAEVTYIVNPSVATDSEAEVMDEEDGGEMSSLSRTSSERSSGHITRHKDKELSVEIPKVTVEDEELALSTPPPPLPPRASKILAQTGMEHSPPLPPRNPNLSSSTPHSILDVVVPVTPLHTPGDRRSKKSDHFNFGKENYGDAHSDIHSDIECPDYELAKPESYLDYDPASPRMEKKERWRTSGIYRLWRYIKNAGTGDPKMSSSSYIYPDNISDWPKLHGENSDDEELYIELEDDQIYGRQDKVFSTKFESEPLYQWYAKDKIISSKRQLSASDVSEEGDTSGDERSAHRGSEVYEDVERLLKKSSTRRGKVDEQFERNAPARRSVIMDVFSKSGTLHRALWCEMPEVIRSGILSTMDPQEKKIQESMFEIMTSEASYLRSLNVLINVFLKAPEFSADMSDRCVITKRERQFLFSNIGTIRDISAKFLADLEARWQKSVVMGDICDIVAEHAEKNFEPYIRYCSNQAFQERALESLQKRVEVAEVMKRLEQHKDCQYLPMSSFLLLPMQRITRLPLLVDAIRHRLDSGSPRHASATRALEYLNGVVRQCNEGAKKMLQIEQMCLLNDSLEFTKVKKFPLVSSSRYLVKQGELTRVVTEGTSRIPFGKGWRGPGKEHVFLFLCSDILLITKKRGNVYQVRDYCQRNSLHTEPIESAEKSRHLPQGAVNLKHLFLVALLSNHESKQVEMVLSAKSESERTRWLDAIIPKQSNPEYERIYEDWDCPQVQCVEKYIAQEPDELTLEESDVVNVFKKMSDGWYEGERIRDGERGWFPADHTEEINNSHVRARNLRLRYRLMIASQEYTDFKFPTKS